MSSSDLRDEILERPTRETLSKPELAALISNSLHGLITAMIEQYNALQSIIQDMVDEAEAAKAAKEADAVKPPSIAQIETMGQIIDDED